MQALELVVDVDVGVSFSAGCGNDRRMRAKGLMRQAGLRIRFDRRSHQHA